MKKLYLGIVLLSSILFVSACTPKEKETTSSEQLQTSTIEEKEFSTDKIISISTKDILNKFENKEEFYLYVGRPTCPTCQILKPYLETALEYEYIGDIFYLNTDKEKGSDETVQQLTDTLDSIDVMGVPAILYISYDEEGNVSPKRLQGEFIEDTEMIANFLTEY